MSLCFFMQEEGDADIEVTENGKSVAKYTTKGIAAPELGYNPSQTNYARPYLPFSIPFGHKLRIDGLKENTAYGYKVTCGGAKYENSFRTAPSSARNMRFICYSDSETEPESMGKRVAWEDPRDRESTRRYFVDQTEGYASNIVEMVRRKPDLILISGDLVEMGSKQVDWDEFWRHNAGEYNDPGGSIPIIAAPGNHEYNSYSARGGEEGIEKFLTYFDYPPAVKGGEKERYHRLDYGNATLLFLDLNNGVDGDGERDTNFYLAKEKGSKAPDFDEGSMQWQWLEEQLKDGQRKGNFLFVFSHHCPFSVGYHGRKNGEKGLSQYEEELSGTPSRLLLPLLLRYGVHAWICGHDEILERSEVVGEKVSPDGKKIAHKLQIYDVGYSGDGLRGYERTSCPNAFEKFRAHKDSIEKWENGILVDGGKHYGHLEININTNCVGRWEATFSPVYIFVSTNSMGATTHFERRVYDDEIVVPL